MIEFFAQAIEQKDRKLARQTDRNIDRQKDRQIERQKDRKKDRQKDRKMNILPKVRGIFFHNFFKRPEKKIVYYMQSIQK